MELGGGGRTRLDRGIESSSMPLPSIEGFELPGILCKSVVDKCQVDFGGLQQIILIGLEFLLQIEGEARGMRGSEPEEKHEMKRNIN